ncbi:hypothetical protein FWK35_00008314 [Aphis craccivora]|uniref:Uncharacterized protein n=1 Tax=Aphis craccivora TaxID=307492 RepID=A0A6G0YWH1_APHCR|nr:hypothetical protein FWK35_00008314 [Aphis craccivora]
MTLHFSILYKKVKSKHFLTQNQYSTKSIFYMVVIQKLITFKCLRNLLKTRKFASFELTIIIKELTFWCIQAVKTQTTFFTNHWKLYPRLTNHLRSE